ncbi:HAMP domain-containing histidine kinase [Streptomyces sp. NBC_00536]|uniref:sensor histidine kinase n=1 Tax=Streptomyces sp. NBC_00536 TaxID=2975769 RepID=UPI002E811257|nr:HAMP domain-containing sensor histidine kinase [Streptomyces sp. NBC_00536]WUC80278.1 HAMP domain-containing histidine kinase [Streptomyces sp. NBC_00536]
MTAVGRVRGLPRLRLRWKIAALAAATACLVAVAVGLLVHVWTAHEIRGRAERDAFNGVYAAMDTYRRTGALPSGAELDPPELPYALRNPADGDRHVSYGGSLPGSMDPTVWGAQRTGGPGSPVLAVHVAITTEFHELYRLDATMAVASLIALAVTTPLAVYGAGLLGRRLGRVSETAGRIAAGDLDARTGPTRGRDEVADIAATVDLMADTLSRRLRDERRFTADVAHELRTPVGGLLAAADLLPDGETEDLLRARVRDLRGLVEDLLEISRLDAGAERPVRARVPLAEVVAEAVARTGFDAEVTESEGSAAAAVETDPRRLERIVGNLVVNAHRHGRAPVSVTVDAGARTVVVRDHGPGFPPDLLRGGPRRFHTGAAERGSGHGLGLTIALGQAGVLGAELRLANAPDGGAVATLRLPV